MLNRSWGVTTTVRPILFALALLLAACAPAAAPTPLPTLTLIPPTATLTPAPLVPTLTSPARTNPADLRQTPTPAVLPVPAAVQGLVAQAVAALAADLDVPPEAVRLVEIREAVWYSVDYGCGEERLPGVDDLAIPGYRLVFTVDDAEYAFHTDQQTTIRRCTRPDRVFGETHSLPGADPVAEALVALARRRILSASPDAAVTGGQVRAVVWPDTSLGCPQPGSIYTAAEIDGYRIEFAVDDTPVIFHTDFERLVQCAPGDERLPE